LRVAVFLPPKQAAQVRAALELHDEFRVAESWETLETLIRREPLSVVVFNPAADGTMDVTRACKLIRRFVSTPFVAYVPLDAPFARGIAHMSNDGLKDLVVVRANDSPERLRATLERASSKRELTALIDALQPWFRRLPASLADVLIDALMHPHKYPSAEAIGTAAGMTLSGLYRSFRSAQLNSPKHFVVGAHVFKGFLYLKDIGLSVRDIAAKLGYTKPRIFARQIQCILGEPPSIIRKSLGSDDAVQSLIEWLGSDRGVPARSDCHDQFGSDVCPPVDRA
jgi:AraC-like DNA-binding protein